MFYVRLRRQRDVSCLRPSLNVQGRNVLPAAVYLRSVCDSYESDLCVSCSRSMGACVPEQYRDVCRFYQRHFEKGTFPANGTDRPVMSGEKQIAVVLIQPGPIAPYLLFRPGRNAVPRRWSLMQRLTMCKMFMSRIIFAEIINNYENYITFIHTVLTIIKNLDSNNVWT